MAADIGIVQGATLALFYALSANARNLILNEAFPVSAQSMMVARIVLVLPIAGAAFWLSAILSNIDSYLAAVLILRRVVEWLGEVHLSEMERSCNRKSAQNYLIVQITLLIVALAWSLGNMPFPLLGMFAWAILPLFLSARFIGEAFQGSLSELKDIWKRLLPHLGSTTVIGVSVYVFRLLIILLLGKDISGDLFTAFAMGGILGSVFSNALGPSLALHQKRNATRTLPIIIRWALLASLITGIVFFSLAFFDFDVSGWMGKSLLFWKAAGLSMIGGVVMAYAQIIRHRFLQHHEGQDLYGPDVLMNILIIATVPCVYYLFGIQGMASLFLLNSLLAFLFYLSCEMEERLLVADVTRVLIAAMMLLPLFFQISSGIFNETAIVFDSGGDLTRLPIPISVLACFGGILLVGAYRRSIMSLNFIFFSFILMIATTVIGAHDQLDQQRDKLILMIQIILPMFGLVLGQVYEPEEASDSHYLEKAFLYVLVAIVPLQLLFTHLKGSVYLYPNLYLFSIYQHLQYVPVIVVSAFLIAFYGLWRSPKAKIILLIMAPIMGIYVAASMSMLATGLLLCGLLGFAIYQWKLSSEKQSWAVLLLVVVACLSYFNYGRALIIKNQQLLSNQIEHTLAFGNNILPLDSSLHTEKTVVMPKNVSDRIYYWKYYIEHITSSAETFLIGHAERLDRIRYPSAHNYYLDFIYSFGALALLPMLVVFGFTVIKIYLFRREILASPSLLALSAMVLFLLVIDNILKVGLKQPYPGIYTFFLWGILLSKLSVAANNAHRNEF